jgi:two-component system NtrC family sensor kinase
MSNKVAAQSLQQKVSLTLLIVMGAMALLSYVTLQGVVAPAFDQLELDEARTNLVRAERAIQNDIQNLAAITGDWGLWDDAYDYVRGEYPAFEDGNLDRPTLTNLGLNLLAIYDVSGEMVWGQLEYLDNAEDIGLLGVLNRDNDVSSFLINHTDPASQIFGLLRTDLGPMIFTSWPVVRSDGSGPIAGTMIMGQFLDEQRLAGLRERTEVNLGWTLIDSPADIDQALELPLNGLGEGSMHHETLPTAVISTGVLQDLFGNPLLILEVSTPRSISSLGHSTVNGALLFLGLAAVIVAVVTWWSLRRMIVSPLAGLAAHITSIRKSGDLTHKLTEVPNDEIGALAHEFDKLTDELHEARKLLLDQSFKAGKADTAAEVLHNIRNAMTPMINGIDRLGKNFAATDKLKVKQAIEALTSPDCPADKVEKYFQYIDSAFSHIAASNQDAAENLQIASKQARQVEAILADQERHAHAVPVIEKLSLDEVVDEAVLVIPKADLPEIDLELADGVYDISVRAHRVGLLQVMGNLVLNAYESIQRSDSPSGRIGISVCQETEGEQPMVRLVIADTGCGFDEDTGEKIFQRGFSSKEGHMSGLGLHWCANALAGMGGRIQAESKGPGHGAEFHVLLPAAQGGYR